MSRAERSRRSPLPLSFRAEAERMRRRESNPEDVCSARVASGNFPESTSVARQSSFVPQGQPPVYEDRKSVPCGWPVFSPSLSNVPSALGFPRLQGDRAR
jgi:hypothetical protein